MKKKKWQIYSSDSNLMNSSLKGVINNKNKRIIEEVVVEEEEEER